MTRWQEATYNADRIRRLKNKLMDGVALPTQDVPPMLRGQWSDDSGKTWHDAGPALRGNGDSMLLAGLPSSKSITVRLVPEAGE